MTVFFVSCFKIEAYFFFWVNFTKCSTHKKKVQRRKEKNVCVRRKSLFLKVVYRLSSGIVVTPLQLTKPHYVGAALSGEFAFVFYAPQLDCQLFALKVEGWCCLQHSRYLVWNKGQLLVMTLNDKIFWQAVSLQILSKS